MPTIIQDLHSSNPGEIIDLFELDLSYGSASADTSVFRWHSGLSENLHEIVWQGNVYSAAPILAEGFEYLGKGSLPRPTLSIANVSSMLSSLVREFDDLIGAQVTRRRTFSKYLDSYCYTAEGFSLSGVCTNELGDEPSLSKTDCIDATKNGSEGLWTDYTSSTCSGNWFPNPSSDTSMELDKEIWYVDRKEVENSTYLKFALVAAHDLQGVTLPNRHVSTNYCPWKYKGAECGFTNSIKAVGASFRVSRDLRGLDEVAPVGWDGIGPSFETFNSYFNHVSNVSEELATSRLTGAGYNTVIITPAEDPSMPEGTSLELRQYEYTQGVVWELDSNGYISHYYTNNYAPVTEEGFLFLDHLYEQTMELPASISFKVLLWSIESRPPVDQYSNEQLYNYVSNNLNYSYPFYRPVIELKPQGGGFVVPKFTSPPSIRLGTADININVSLIGAPVDSIEVLSGGQGYPDAVELLEINSTGVGSGLQASAVASGGVIQSASVDAPGSGYTGHLYVETLPYDTLVYFDAHDNACPAEEDLCSKTLKGCTIRFPSFVPFGGFPGINTKRGG